MIIELEPHGPQDFAVFEGLPGLPRGRRDGCFSRLGRVALGWGLRLVVHARVERGMDGRRFVLAICEAARVAAARGVARVVPTLFFVERVLVLRQVGQKEAGKAAAAVQEIARIAAQEARAEPCVALLAIFQLPGYQRAARQGPQHFVDPQIDLPHLVG